MADGRDILAAGGGGDKKQRQPIEAPDSLHSVAYARVDDAVSEGPIKGLVNGLKSIYYNETPLENPDGTRNFQRVQVDWRLGTQDQDPIPGFGTVENEIGVNVELTAANAWTQAITNPALDGVRVLITVPMLVKTDTSTGDTSGNSVSIAFDIATDGGAFVEVKVDQIAGKTTSEYQRSYRFDLPKAVSGWIIRARRLTPDSTSQTNVSNTFISSFTELVDAKLRYPNTAHFTTSIDAAQFQSVPSRAFDLEGREIRVPSNYDADTRTYTGIWDGTFKIAYTNCGPWAFYDLITHTRYGLGHLVDVQQVNKWALYKIARWCDQMVDDGQGGLEPRLAFNVFIQTQEDAYKVMADFAGAFHAAAYWAGAAIHASADMPEDPVYCYAPANVIDGKFEYAGSGRRARHTVAVVAWNDIHDFGRAKVEYVEDQEGIARYGVNQTDVIAIGCTSRMQARRHGKLLLATERLETDMATIRIGLDGTFCAPGQVIQLADPLRMGDRMAGRISAATATTVTIDRMPGTLPVAGDPLKVIGTDARMMERVIASVDAAARTLTVTAAFDTIPVPHSMWMVERTDLTAPSYRVMSVVEESENIYAISALEHHPEKYAWVDTPDELQPAPAGLDRGVTPVSNATVSSFNRTTEYATETVVAVDWQRPLGAMAYDIEWRKDQGEWVKLPRQVESRLEVTNARPGEYVFRIAAVNMLGLPSLMRYTEPFAVADEQSAPGAVAELRDGLATQQVAATEALAEGLGNEAQTRAAEILAQAQAQAQALAQRDAAIANLANRLGAISSDGLITPDEKPDLIRDYQIIVSERPGLVAEGTAADAITERDDYDDSVSALVAYMSTLTIPVPWFDTGGDTLLT